jgi:hypothetical protein
VEHLPPIIGRMRTHLVVIAAALFASGAVLTAPVRADTPATEYSLAVAHICAGSLLFDHAHSIGTRAGALAVARDIRASTAHRLARVEAVPAPRTLRRLSRRWIALQRRLAAVYARDWIRIYDAIDGARTPAQRAGLGQRLERLVAEPGPLRSASGRLEVRLHVPDCTGGG